MKTRLIVINEHTLGYQLPSQVESHSASILHASILKGSPYSDLQGPIYVKNHKTRLASAKDFENFRVSFVGYENRDLYEYE